MATTQNPNDPDNLGLTPTIFALIQFHISIVLLLNMRAFPKLILKLEHIYNFFKSKHYWDGFMLLFSLLILYLLDHLPWYMSSEYLQ